MLGAGNIIESIAVGRTDPLQKSAETMYDQEIRAASINKPQVPDQLVEFNMLKNDKAEETKVDSTFDWNVLDGAKDSKKGMIELCFLIYSLSFFYMKQ